MRALFCNKPGELIYGQVPEPARAPGETLIRIEKIGICGTDLHAFEGVQPYFTYPRILGHELAGTIVETDASDFEPGEPVTFIPYFNCKHCIACRQGKPNCCSSLKVCGVHVDGGMVDYLSVPSYSLVHGQGLSFDELALVEPLAIGAHGIRRAMVTPGEYVLVVGAGPIGLGTMEFARIAGARVIAMDINERRLQFCREKLRVAHTVNPVAADAKEQLMEITNGDMPTAIIDATGNLNAINQSFSFLAHGGRFVLIGLQKGDITVSHPEFHKREATLMSSRNATRADFEHVIDSMNKGLVDPTTYITHRVSFESLGSSFASLLDPANKVIKAMVDLKR